MFRNRTSPPEETMRAKVLHTRPEQEYWFREGCHILEVSNHPGDPEVSIARARLDPGGVTEWHSVIGTWERYLVVAGHGVAELGGLEPAPVGPGDVVCIPPGVPQRIRNTGEEDLVFYAICSPRFSPASYRAHASGDPA
jgi:mannose-6-phosphate isomerase-like protein (cupin superfamily)